MFVVVVELGSSDGVQAQPTLQNGFLTLRNGFSFYGINSFLCWSLINSTATTTIITNPSTLPIAVPMILPI